jgi:hypothetical protein
MKPVLLQEGKKKFEKQTAKFCMSQERYLNLSTKKQDAVLKEVSTDRHVPAPTDCITKGGACSQLAVLRVRMFDVSLPT